jgi:hypothetical protein
MMLASTLDSALAACRVRLRAYTSMKGVAGELACTKIERVVSSEASIAGAPHPPSGLPEWLQTQAGTHGAGYSYNRATVAIGISRTLLPDSRFLRR